MKKKQVWQPYEWGSLGKIDWIRRRKILGWVLGKERGIRIGGHVRMKRVVGGKD